MRKIVIFVSTLLLTASLWAQAPLKMNYQAVIRDGSNNLIVNKKVGVKISILQGSEMGTLAYEETHTPTTNANGLATFIIGVGNMISGDFSKIDWSKGDFFIKTETDPEGGDNYSIIGTSQLLSVPFALYAANYQPGPKGDTGAQGPIGLTGTQGLKGDKGDTGATGLTGAQGLKGDKGDTGNQGLQGLKGDTGAQGPIGLIGAQGLKGDKGDTGTQGIQGAQGLKGDKGDIGATGLTGAQGLKGDKGDTGATGLTGAQGLKGDKGDTGAQGIQGAQGLKGDKGDIGATGLTGAQGLKGDKGDIGATGLTGAQGLKGDKGDTGAQGLQGPAGAVGANGATGPQGLQGPAGPKGDTPQIKVSVSLTGDTLKFENGNFVIIPGISAAQPKPTSGYGVNVSDVDGNSYKTVYIGTQQWMAENLKATKYNDGTTIPNITDNTQWQNDTTGAWSYYNNDAANNAKYGKLYNWYAVSKTSNGNKNVCPTGWHVPTDAEWTVLTNYLGGETVAGGKMKEVGTTSWNSPNIDATNTSLFTGLPGGYRRLNGGYDDIGYVGFWWSSTEVSTNDAWYRTLYSHSGSASRNYFNNRDGFSVRCLRD
jgi:uncharacterized protein (TIGR02145 family)